MICLWCEEEMLPVTTWTTLLLPDRQSKLCKACRGELWHVEANTQHCKKCRKRSDRLVCEDCHYWESRYGGDPLERNWALYEYNDVMKEMVAKWKYRGDYILGEMFREDFKAFYLKMIRGMAKDMMIVPLPLSKERMRERGFNQAEMLAKFLSPSPSQPLERIHGEKQSKRNREERMSSHNPFFMETAVNKPVLLVDDIYTTGTTIRHAATLLKEQGCPRVYSYTLVRG